MNKPLRAYPKEALKFKEGTGDIYLKEESSGPFPWQKEDVLYRLHGDWWIEDRTEYWK